MNDVQEKIELLVAKGWSQAAIADELGVTLNAVQKWKYGDRYPSNAKLVLNALDALSLRKKIPKRRRYKPGSRRRMAATGEESTSKGNSG